ncbi:MAG: VWA domain-containing protein [Myxococcota bacterium]
MQQVSTSGAQLAVTSNIHAFVSLLRHHGVRCGVAEVLDAFQALQVMGDAAFESRDGMRAALRSTLIKSMADATVFDRLFDLFFTGGVEADERLAESLMDQLLERMHGEGEVAALMQILQDMEGQLSQLTQAILGAQTAHLQQLMRRAISDMDLSGMQSRLQLGYFAQRLMSRLGVDGLDRDLAALRERLGQELPPEAAQAAMGVLEERAAALRQTARSAMEAELEKRDTREIQRKESLMQKSFARLTPEEVARMRQVVRQLAERLKSVVRRRRVERRGYLDVRHTLRRNMGLGGVPVDVHFRRKTKDRPQLAVLCDVSDSVRHASMFMLQLVYTLQELFTRVRSFVFVSELGEATRLFKDHSVDEAVDLTVAGKVTNLYANSNFGHAFLMFHRQHMDAITRNTTVIILGDGRNNYNPHNAWVLHEMRRRARKLLWLCTEDRNTWGFGDSEMAVYARACDQVEVVQNLAQLRKAVDAILR